MVLDMQPGSFRLGHWTEGFGNGFPVAAQCQHMMFLQIKAKLFVLLWGDRYEENTFREIGTHLAPSIVDSLTQLRGRAQGCLNVLRIPREPEDHDIIAAKCRAVSLAQQQSSLKIGLFFLSWITWA